MVGGEGEGEGQGDGVNGVAVCDSFVELPPTVLPNTAPPAADGKIMPTEDDDGRLGGPSNSEARPISNVLARAARLTMIEQT